MNSSDIYYIEVLSNIPVYLHKYVLPIIYILGNIGNFFSILVFSKKSWKKNVCVFYFNVCLFFNTCYINSYILGSIFIYGFNINIQDRNIILCKLFFYIGFFFSTLFPTVLILASIDRLLISSQNVNTRLYSSKRLAYFSISMSTIFWFIFFFHVLIKVNIQELYPSFFFCFYDLSYSYLAFVSYSSAVIITFFCVTMIILSILSFKNVRRIRSIPRQQQRQQIRTMTKKDFQLLRCLFAQDIVFIIFSIFLNVYYVYGAVTIDRIQTPIEQAINNFLLNFLNLLHHLPFCASFIIFIVVSKAFRTELKRMVFKIIGKNLVPMREEDNVELKISNNVVSPT